MVLHIMTKEKPKKNIDILTFLCNEDVEPKKNQKTPKYRALLKL